MTKRFLIGALFTAFGLGACWYSTTATPVQAQDVVKGSEAERIALIRKVQPTVVSIFIKDFQGDPRGRIVGGGSGVLIDENGYCLTNFHVVDAGGAISPTFACGLSNGQLYDAVTVGVDMGGDVALIKLFPKTPGEKFPFAELGDSETVKPGDWSIIMGNAQLLSTDFTPSVSFGLISGVNRYADFGFAEHTDAIQYDTTANQGNSGGPIFNMKGQVIGQVFGGAPGKRGAFNTGIGYGLPVNLAKNFLVHMRAGCFCDHATLGATVKTETADEGEISRLVVNQVLEESDAARRGLTEGDQLLRFAGRQLGSVNQYKSVLGIYPKEWRLPLTYQRGNEKKETLVRLMSYTPERLKRKDDQPGPKGGNQPPRPKPKAFGEGAKFWEERKGFANYHYNRKERDRVLESAKKLADYSSLTGDWSISGTYEREARAGEFLLKIAEVPDPNDAKATKPVVSINLGLTEFVHEPLNTKADANSRTDPPFSGGLLMAMYQYKRFLNLGPKGSERDGCSHAGMEPVYIMPADGSKPKRFEDVRLFCEVIRTDHVDVPAKWYYYRADLNPQFKDQHPYADGTLIAAEVLVDRDTDPCELTFGDFKESNGRKLPHTMEVRFGDRRFGTFAFKAMQMK
jgi:serine protease Do